DSCEEDDGNRDDGGAKRRPRVSGHELSGERGKDRMSSMKPDVDVARSLVGQVRGRRRLLHDDSGKDLRLKTLEVARPFLVVIRAHREADRAVVVLCEVRKA